jgi:probable HAF family extracellular repeat protein
MRLSVTRVRQATLRAVLLASSAMLPGLAQADDFQGLGLLPGTDTGVTTGLSANGLVVIGAGFNSGSNFSQYSFVWSNGVMNQITGVGLLSQPTGVDADGSVVVGYSYGSFATGWVWTQSAGAVAFAPPSGFNFALPSAVNADGSVIVGTASGNLPDRAFRWTQTGGTVLLGVLPGDTYSYGNAVSGDGMVVVGQSLNTGSQQTRAFRWTQTGGMVDLGALPGATFTTPTATNFDGSVVVGYSINTTSTHAFRWQASKGLTALPELPGAQLSEAYAVNYDGSVIVGVSGSASSPFGEAAVWNKNGVQSIRNLLVANGVNLAGWTLAEAQGVSADGTIVAGTGQDPSGKEEPWIARISKSSGLITPTTVQQSFSGQSAVGESGNAALGSTFSTITSYATQTYESSGRSSSPYSGFAYGGYDSDPTESGTLGIVRDLPDAMLVGATVSANYIKTNMVFDGSAKFSAGTAGAFVARIPQSGLEWLVGIGGIASEGDIKRGYLNGSGPSSSDGHTIANGYGGTARIGWTFDKVLAETKVTPFASYSITTLRTNGYTETGGPFPAEFDGFTDTAEISRLGADASYTFAPGEWIWGTLDWAHRFGGGNSATIAGSLIGIFALATPGASVMQDWAEITAGFRIPIWKTAALTASLTASIPEHSTTTYRGLFGVTARL